MPDVIDAIQEKLKKRKEYIVKTGEPYIINIKDILKLK